MNSFFGFFTVVVSSFMVWLNIRDLILNFEKKRYGWFAADATMVIYWIIMLFISLFSVLL